MKNIRKIGVYIGVPGLGDLLFIIPLFKALKQGFPGAEVKFIGKLVREYVRPVFDACPYIDGIMEYHFYDPGTIVSHAAFVSALRKEKFDLLVDTQRKFMPSALLKLGGAKHIVSYSTKGIFSDYKVAPSGDRSLRHTADVSLDLARAVGLDPKIELELTVPESNRAYAGEFFAKAGIEPGAPVAGLVASASEPTRRWRPENFAALAAKLISERGMAVICLGSAADADTIEQVKSAAGFPVIVEDFTRRNVLDSAALMLRCSVVIGNISGPLHVADAVGVPCVGIYGPHPPGRFGLLGPRARTVCLNLDCAPCQTPACEHRRCVTDITVEQVYSAALESLGDPDNA